MKSSYEEVGRWGDGEMGDKGTRRFDFYLLTFYLLPFLKL